MKGMSFAILLVVTAIVILIVALVVITLFMQTALRFGDITSARSYCRGVAVPSCLASGTLPLSWGDNNLLINDVANSCRGILPDCRCEGNSAANCGTT